jgi:hypothetical protein
VEHSLDPQTWSPKCTVLQGVALATASWVAGFLPS